jgi:hypothetical protein
LHLTNSQQGLLPFAGHPVGSRSVRESWPLLLPVARPSPSTLPQPQQFQRFVCDQIGLTPKMLARVTARR